MFSLPVVTQRYSARRRSEGKKAEYQKLRWTTQTAVIPSALCHSLRIEDIPQINETGCVQGGFHGFKVDLCEV